MTATCLLATLVATSITAATATTVRLEIPTSDRSLAQCSGGQFCVWGQASYMGSFRYRSGTGAKDLGGPVGSVWNNRSTAARLYSNTGVTSICLAAGAKRASLSSSYSSAAQVALLSGASC